MNPERRKFSKAFKEAIAQCVDQGTPVKELARQHQIDPAVVRQWRDAFRELGSGAFAGGGRRRLTREFKEAAVLRVESGKPVKEVARAYRIHPSKLRAWREVWRRLGVTAFSDTDPKISAVIFRLTQSEHQRLKAIAKEAGARNMSEFARSRLLTEIAHAPMMLAPPLDPNLEPKTNAVLFRVSRSEHHRLKAIVKAAGARSFSLFARERLLGNLVPPPEDVEIAKPAGRAATSAAS